MHDGLVTRPATPEDWSAIWPIFEAVVGSGETYTYPADVTEAQARALWIMPPPWHVLVILDEAGIVIGTAKVGPNQPGRGAHVANASAMIAPDAAGKGAGRALGAAMIACAQNRGYRSMQFNAVVATNIPALRLWSSLGFEIVGVVPEAFLHPTKGYVGLNVMYRSL